MLITLGKQIFSKRLNLRLFSSATSFKMSTGDNVGLPIAKVVSVLEEFAPKQLAETWDNTGLLVEPYTARGITKIMLTNDLTEDVALEANEEECQMIISYHPPIFAPLKSVVQSAWKEKIVSFLLESRISLYSPHTSWDSVQGGVNDWLASAFPVARAAPILPGAQPNVGAGRMLNLSSSITLAEAISKVKELTKLQHVRFALARGKRFTDNVETVALCAGSGASVLKGVAADLYVTGHSLDQDESNDNTLFVKIGPVVSAERGEMLHHDVLDAAQKGTSVILTNHSDSERGFLRVFSTNLQKLLENQVQVVVSNRDKDPLVTV